MSSPDGVTQLLEAIAGGDDGARERLIQLLYPELRRRAAAYMRRERPDHTLQPTALVHEAYLKLLPQRVRWQNQSHFLGVAAQQMRRVLLDHARKRKVRSSEGKVQLDDALAMAAEQPADLIAVHELLANLSAEHERQAKVVELRFFGGLTEDEIARMLHTSVETVKRDWRFSKAWLAKRLRGPSLQ